LEKKLLGLGSKVSHQNFGKGIIVDVSMSEYTVWIKNRGEVQITHSDDRLEVINEIPLNGDRLTLKEVKQAINSIFHHWNVNQDTVELGEKWLGGMLILKPNNPDIKSKEIPIETFFHKIVMVRDRIRVMEQKINSSKNLNDEEKIDLQQYLTRIYGSLTTFNVLFKRKEDHFRGESSKS